MWIAAGLTWLHRISSRGITSEIDLDDHLEELDCPTFVVI